jgi:copper transport protein
LAALLVLLAALWPLVSPTPALAHSQLLRSDPKAGTILDTPPQQITLEMSESIGTQFSTITLYDRSRKEQPLGPLTPVDNNPNKVKVDVTSPLGPGSYTVLWRVVSGIDGHLTQGTFAFRIRGTGASGTPEPEETPVPVLGVVDSPTEGSAEAASPFRWLLRGIMLAAAAILTGGPLFVVLIMEPSVGDRPEVGAPLWRAATRRLSQIGWVAACVLLLALLVDLLAEVAAIAQTSFFGALARNDLALELIKNTRYGFAWSMKAVAAAILIVLFAWMAYRKPRTADVTTSGLWEICIAAGSFLLLAEALSSHGAAVVADHIFGLPLPVVSDWLHLVTAAAWIGGLIFLGAALFPAFRAVGLPHEERRAFLARSIPRFSRLAIFSVAILAVTGTYNLVVHSSDVGTILSSAYGQIVGLKVVLLIALTALGAVNLLRLTPLLKAAAPAPESAETAPASPDDAATKTGPVRALRRNVRTEIVLAGVVLMCAGGLTLLPPPSGSARVYSGGIAEASGTPHPMTVTQGTPGIADTPGPPTATPGPVVAYNTVGGYNFALETLPNVEGDQLTLTVEKSLVAAPPLTDVAKVVLKVSPQGVGGGIGSTSYTANAVGAVSPERGVWQAKEQILTLEGEYLITALVQRTEAPDVRAAFRLTLSGDGGLTATAGDAVEVRVSTEPSPPISGTATLTLKLVDGAGAPIEGAKVSVDPIMPSHAHVEPTGVAQAVAGQPGAYTLKVNFVMGGGWLLVFNVERDGRPPVKADASLDVIDPNATPTPTPSP